MHSIGENTRTQRARLPPAVMPFPIPLSAPAAPATRHRRPRASPPPVQRAVPTLVPAPAAFPTAPPTLVVRDVEHHPIFPAAPLLPALPIPPRLLEIVSPAESATGAFPHSRRASRIVRPGGVHPSHGLRAVDDVISSAFTYENGGENIVQVHPYTSIIN